MEKGRSLLRWAFCLAVAAVLTGYGLTAEGVEGPGTETKEAKDRADIIRIDTLKVFGELERSEVVFLHDQHTDALAEKKKDCRTCHLEETDTLGKKRLSVKFMRLKDTGKQEVMDIYHDNCIDCHTETAAANEKTGPLVCGKCHLEKSPYISDRQPMGMDRSLHYRHVKVREKKCEQCHHEYNEMDKKLVYVEGKEGTCRYCHKQQDEENRMSMRKASHLSCVDCHRTVLMKNPEAGPVKCAGCHSLEAQKKIEVLKDIPRMERGQPDYVFVKRHRPDPYTAEEAIAVMEKKEDETLMNKVPFTHMEHEKYNDTCRVCHHASLEPCAKCHTLTGDKEGSYVRLEMAMHQVDSEKSCQGCHELKKENKNCAGCHEFMFKNRRPDKDSCQACHMPSMSETMGKTAGLMDSPGQSGAAIEQTTAQQSSPMPTGGEETAVEETVAGQPPVSQETGITVARIIQTQESEKTSSSEQTSKPGTKHEVDPRAKKLLEARNPVTGTYPEKDIPEKVLIRILSKEYDPVDLPHRKIVNTLMKNIEDNKMVQHFHRSPGTLCQGCHHNSPVSKKPPRCESCHGKPFDNRDPIKPGLMAAYHQQCMGCHDRMGIEKPESRNCTSCHKKRP